MAIRRQPYSAEDIKIASDFSSGCKWQIGKGWVTLSVRERIDTPDIQQ